MEPYEVQVTRDTGWWLVDVPKIDYRTQARTLAEVEEMARSLIAGALDVEEHSFDLDVHVAQPEDVDALLKQASDLEQQARTATARAARDRREAARMLRQDHGLSAIDIARVLGVSRPRAYQLLDGSQKTTA